MSLLPCLITLLPSQLHSRRGLAAQLGDLHAGVQVRAEVHWGSTIPRFQAAGDAWCCPDMCAPCIARPHLRLAAVLSLLQGGGHAATHGGCLPGQALQLWPGAASIICCTTLLKQAWSICLRLAFC